MYSGWLLRNATGKVNDTMKTAALRGLFLAIGVMCTALGVVGAFVPVLPTTPFLLVAVWAFGKSSPRLQRWLLDHPRFGPSLHAFTAQGVIPLKIKWIALPALFASVVAVYGLAGQPVWLILHTTMALATATYIATRPSVYVIAKPADSNPIDVAGRDSF